MKLSYVQSAACRTPQISMDGKGYLCLKAGTSVEIGHAPKKQQLDKITNFQDSLPRAFSGPGGEVAALSPPSKILRGKSAR